MLRAAGRCSPAGTPFRNQSAATTGNDGRLRRQQGWGPGARRSRRASPGSQTVVDAGARQRTEECTARADGEQQAEREGGSVELIGDEDDEQAEAGGKPEVVDDLGHRERREDAVTSKPPERPRPHRRGPWC